MQRGPDQAATPVRKQNGWESLTMKMLLNTWYVAAFAHEIERKLLARTIAGKPVLMFRRENGAVAAISNVCPHRFAPLDRGSLSGDTVQCLYHGLEFGPDGRCTRNPQMDRITQSMHIATYPVVERDGFVWVWTGSAPADPALIPDMSAFADREGGQTTRSYLFTNYRYDVLIDNLLDLTHADYLHKGSFSAGAAERDEVEVFEDGDTVTVQRTQLGTPTPPLTYMQVEKVDMATTIRWTPSQAVKFEIDIVPAGAPFEGKQNLVFYHIGTPADDGHTHYFMGARFRDPADPEMIRREKELQLAVIDGEDGPMLEAVSDLMAGRDLLEMKPLILPGDAGAVRARTVMKRRLAAEGALEPA